MQIVLEEHEAATISKTTASTSVSGLCADVESELAEAGAAGSAAS